MVAGRKGLLVSYGQRQREVSWYSGASDAAILKTVAVALGLSMATEIIARDPSDGCVVVVSDSLPDGMAIVIELAKPTPEVDKLQGTAAGDQQARAEGQEFRGQLIKFERINAHLANERTWLAWVRTALSVMTIALSFIALNEDLGSGFLQFVGTAVGIALVGCVLLTYTTGWLRYSRVKEVLSWRGDQLKGQFGRFSLGWQAKLLAALLAISVPLYIVGAFRSVYGYT